MPRFQSRRELAAKGSVGVGVGAANVVVEMRETGEHQIAPRRQLPQQEQHRHRVRSAGHGCDTRTSRAHSACAAA